MNPTRDQDKPSAKELAAAHGVSERTARRWRQSGRIPSTEPIPDYYGKPIPLRTVGKDGKNYPAIRHHYNGGDGSGFILSALRQARYNLNKADKLACSDGIHRRDLAALDAISAQVRDMMARWHTVDLDQADDG